VNCCAALPGPERETRFYRLWAAKEAALKALGSGLMVAPQRVEVYLSGDALQAPLPGHADTPIGAPITTQITLGPDGGHRPGEVCHLSLCELTLPFALPAQAALAWVAEADARLCW